MKIKNWTQMKKIWINNKYKKMDRSFYTKRRNQNW